MPGPARNAGYLNLNRTQKVDRTVSCWQLLLSKCSSAHIAESWAAQGEAAYAWTLGATSAPLLHALPHLEGTLAGPDHNCTRSQSLTCGLGAHPDHTEQSTLHACAAFPPSMRLTWIQTRLLDAWCCLGGSASVSCTCRALAARSQHGVRRSW